VSESFRRRLGAGFTFLSDQEGRLLDRLNIRHVQGYRGKDIAFPTAILVDKHGIVRWIYEMEYGNVRMRPEELFEAIERMTLEERNRELLRGRAVSEVVKQVFLMEKSTDLADVIRLMRTELQGLGFRFSFCGINIFDEKDSMSRTYGAPAYDPNGSDPKEPWEVEPNNHSLPFVELSLSGLPELEEIVQSWKQARVYYRNYSYGEESSYLAKLRGAGSGAFLSPQPIRCMVHAPFTHGTLALGGEEPNLFTEDDTRTLQEFATAISVGYKRFLDFQELDNRNRELQRTQLQLVQSEKMASLGELAAGVAHELNTPLGAIKSNTDIAAGAAKKVRHSVETFSSPEQAPHKKLLELLSQLESLNRVNRGACERMIKIVQSLRSFARLDEAEWKLADLHQGLNDTLTLIHYKLRDRVRVTKKYGDLPEVACYPKKMNQVFMVLLVNATQAIDGEGEITIQTFRDTDQAVIRISDTGRGIPPESMKRIFDPGFTTKGVRVGTGLGLSICYQIVEEHHGEIEVASVLGEGSTFTVRIPLSRNSTGPPATRG
jgi:signal transduction histidine kinase